MKIGINRKQDQRKLTMIILQINTHSKTGALLSRQGKTSLCAGFACGVL